MKSTLVYWSIGCTVNIELQPCKPSSDDLVDAEWRPYGSDMSQGEQRYRYHAGYVEHVRLRDGTRALLRLIRPSDKQALVEGFGRLSEGSRHARFLGHKQTLSETELRYLTEVDHIDHFALVAARPRLFRKPQGLAVARFVRISGEPDTAEPAITVTDDYQGKGLGTMLLHRLMEAAHERGVKRFRSELRTDNVVMKRMLEELDGRAGHEYSGDGCMVMTTTVPAGHPLEQDRHAVFELASH